MVRDLSNAAMMGPALLPSPLTAPGTPRDLDAPESPWTPLEGERAVALPTVSTAEKIEARYAILASLPLPSGIPEDSLTPILIPTPYTLHDFVGTTAGLLRSQLGNYRVFQQSTTTWCPEREEHGYFLTPMFKCSTNPRVNTAHRWTVADISGKLDKPTECFYNKDGKWYYAGIYKSFRLDDLCPQEWDCLSQETSQALIKETLVGRKNTSPQNVYEVGQLYSVGALKIACIGLQCIGFNTALYRSLLEHAALCTQTGKWRMAAGGGFNVNVNAGLGLGSGASTPWSGGNASVHATPSGPGSPAAMRSVSGALAAGGMAPQTGGGGATLGVMAPGMAPGGRGYAPVTVVGPGPGPSPGAGIGIGLGLGGRQLLSATSGMRIAQHAPQADVDIAGTPGFRPLGKM
uniref:Lipase ATG15 ) n=1 Tax=Ganoderma boninense TaxID=34458 RepID=A0A5K1JT98_9APHY|nr:Putative lipase ATG15 (EC (Autophagy-related protein 15) [Ganoderma boninense]